ncbi:SAV0927 family protein [Pseudobacillus badius]|uniref:SAV0927 family protein n=1 Tax=Bacillus badius TaxID=1455 RepID=UPI000596D34D|nr:SAV0927 family protein [Bacillus badius]KIL76052.1 hypothetical protein SD78_0154 [Bacillus badius]KZR59688.1 hypothetical protein A3781_11555 [Bacillus badius]
MDITFLMDESELQSNRFVCLMTEEHRYDFAIINTRQFLGNSIVLSLQNHRMVLMCEEDIEDRDYWPQRLGIEAGDIEAVQSFLYGVLGALEPAELSY